MFGRYYPHFLRSAYCLCAILSTFSETAMAAAGWTAESVVESYQATDVSTTVILPGSDNPMGCASTTWYRLPSGTANYQAIVAVILSAAGQGRKIKVWANACDTDGASVIIAAWAVP